MDKILEFFHSDLGVGILMSLYMLVEYWLGKTTLVKPGSVLGIILGFAAKILELLGVIKPPDSLK